MNLKFLDRIEEAYDSVDVVLAPAGGWTCNCNCWCCTCCCCTLVV